MKDATTDFVTELPISLGPPEASNPTEQEIIEIVTAKNRELISPTAISEIDTT